MNPKAVVSLGRSTRVVDRFIELGYQVTNVRVRDCTVRCAKPTDLEAILAIETACWPPGDGMRAEKSKFISRIECRFVWVACDVDGALLGMLTAFRPKWARADRLDELLDGCPADLFEQRSGARWQSLVHKYGLPPNWHEATAEGSLSGGALHNPRGEVLYGVGLAVKAQSKRRGIAQILLQTVLAEAATTGARYFLGYGRLPRFHQFPHLDVDTYLHSTEHDAQGVRPLDPQLRFHWSIGAHPIRSVDNRFRYVGIPQSMREDPESHGHGSLIVAPLGAARFPLERLSPE